MSGWYFNNPRYPFTYSEPPESVTLERTDGSETVRYVPEREECRMEPVSDYRIGASIISWGCVCSGCGAFHQFTRGNGWKFCPTCGRRAVGE